MYGICRKGAIAMSEAMDGILYAVVAAPKGAVPTWHIGEALKCSLELDCPVFLQVDDESFIRVSAFEVLHNIEGQLKWARLPLYKG